MVLESGSRQNVKKEWKITLAERTNGKVRETIVRHPGTLVKMIHANGLKITGKISSSALASLQSKGPLATYDFLPYPGDSPFVSAGFFSMDGKQRIVPDENRTDWNGRDPFIITQWERDALQKQKHR